MFLVSLYFGGISIIPLYQIFPYLAKYCQIFPDIAKYYKFKVQNEKCKKQLAKKLKTQQSIISRVENAQTTVSLSFLQRLASVFGGQLKVSFEGI